MAEFVVGQWVECVDTNGNVQISVGRYYRVRDAGVNVVTVDALSSWYEVNRFRPVEWQVGKTYKTELPGSFGKILSIDESGDLYGNVVGSLLMLSNYWHAKTGKDFNEQRGANLTPYLADPEPSPAVETTEPVKSREPQPTTSSYHRTIHGVTLDIYDVAEAYEIDSHRVFHAVKKLVLAGRRGHEDREQDLREAIVSIESELKKTKGGA